MQNYLISHVLFDGQEDVHVNNKTGSHLPDVDEEREAREESAAEDRFFETYKQEMEKYFSCFEDEKRVKKKTKKAKGGADKMEEIDKKPNIVNIGSIRNQFENLATSEQPLAEAVEVANPRPKKKVGKLETTKLFEETKRGTLEEIKQHFETHTLKGEIVICVAGK